MAAVAPNPPVPLGDVWASRINKLPLFTIMLIRNFLFFGIIYLFKVDYEVNYAARVIRDAEDKNKKCTVPLEKDTARKLLTDIYNESKANFWLYSIVWVLAFLTIVCTIVMVVYKIMIAMADPNATAGFADFIHLEKTPHTDEYFFVYVLRLLSEVIDVMIMRVPIVFMTILQEQTLIFIMAILVIDIMRRIHLTQTRLKKISDTQAVDIKTVAEEMSQKNLFKL
jgi:hypothetical protein